MKPQVRDRLVLPLAIPLGALAFIAAVTIGFSRILLGVPESVATAVAIMAAVSVLFVGAVLVLRPRLGSGEILFMVGVAAVPFVLGGAVAAGIIEVGEEEHEPGPEPEPFALSIAAEDIAFDKAEMTAPEGRPLRITFENKDPDQHNVAIFEGDGPDGEKVFTGDIFSGPATETYNVPALEEGNYYFHCDVHPNMSGTLVVEEAVEPPEEPEEEAAEIIAENIAFDTDSLTLSAEGTTIVFENKDTVPHNVAIFEGDGIDGEKVFTGVTFPGPATETYSVPALQPGNYYFHCDVHPNMSGTAQVR